MTPKILAQENNQVRLLGEMTNTSALSEKKPPLVEEWYWAAVYFANQTSISLVL